MRFKGVSSSFAKQRISLYGANNFTVLARRFANYSPNNLSLDITQRFIDDTGIPRQAFPDDPLQANNNNEAFNAALNSVRYSDITIPTGRYYLSAPIKMSNTDSQNTYKPLPKKTIRGDNNSVNTTFYNLGYPLTLNCPSTVLDFSLVPNSIAVVSMFSISGCRDRLQELSAPLEQGNKQLTVTQNQSIRDNDLLLITDSNRFSYSVRDGYRKGEFLSVKTAQIGQANIQLQQAAFDTYDHLDHGTDSKKCRIAKINPMQIQLENLSIVDRRVKNGELRTDSSGNKYINMLQGAWNALMITHCIDSEINNICIIDASWNSGLTLRNCLRVRVNSGMYIMAKPDKSRLLQIPNAYSVYGPNQDSYAIITGDSQEITFHGVDARSWGHAIATGSGSGLGGDRDVDSSYSIAESSGYGGDRDDEPTFNYTVDTVFSVNRNIQILNSTIINTPANLYYSNEEIPSALAKRAPANFHANTEMSMYMNNLLIGGGFNVGGHNNSFINNTIYSDNKNERMMPNSHYQHEDPAIQFNEAKSGKFLIQGNKVYINKFYQPRVTGDYSFPNSNFRVGEFVTFSIGRFRNLRHLTPEERSRIHLWDENGEGDYLEGTLTIVNNEVFIQCFGESQDNNSETNPPEPHYTGLITVGGVHITSEPENTSSTQNAIRIPRDVSVFVSNNTFSIFNNPKKSQALVTVNPKKTEHNPPPASNPRYAYWTRLKKIDFVNNRFYGFFRLHINRSDIFNNEDSASVTISNNTFISDEVAERDIIQVEKTSQPSISNNVISKY